MPRRPTTTQERVPLCLLPSVVMYGIKKNGDELEWVMVRRMNRHFYTVRIRTKPVNREFRKGRLVKVPVLPKEREAS